MRTFIFNGVTNFVLPTIEGATVVTYEIDDFMRTLSSFKKGDAVILVTDASVVVRNVWSKLSNRGASSIKVYCRGLGRGSYLNQVPPALSDITSFEEIKRTLKAFAKDHM